MAALLAFLGFVNGLAPWTVRNMQVFGEPIPIVDSAYLHLWIGNNPAATGGPHYEAALPFVSTGELEKIDAQPKRYDELGKKVLEEMEDGPSTLRRRMRVAIRSGGSTWPLFTSSTPSPRSRSQPNFRTTGRSW